LPTHKPLVALCRCGQSQSKPFCDGAHKSCGFEAGELAPPAVSPSPRETPTPAEPRH
jgi:CDGSH-type Zn-finger protein